MKVNRMNTIVRIQNITIKNIKNVKNGVADFPNYKSKKYYDEKSEILGIYGQNGSGKTTLINMAAVLKKALSGESLSQDAWELIDCDEESGSLGVVFFMNQNSENYLVYYDLILKKAEARKLRVVTEKLSYKSLNKIKGVRNSRTTLIEVDLKKDVEFSPKNKYKNLLSPQSPKSVDVKIAIALANERNTSCLFGAEVMEILLDYLDDQQDQQGARILSALQIFARRNLCVIENNRLGSILMNLVIPFSFRIDSKEKSTQGEYPIALTGTIFIGERENELITQIIGQINVVLEKLIPGMYLEVFEKSSEFSKNGEKKIQVELISVREGRRVSLKNESDGIVKIISILSSLIAVYNLPSYCMFVDELDSGIFEFLLGEILKVIDDGGKGQLIFTSHNLRPLEVLDSNNILFTTSNRDNRYIHIPNIKRTNNLRDVYLRSILLGGEDEQLYVETDTVTIRKAFRKAGGLFKDE